MKSFKIVTMAALVSTSFLSTPAMSVPAPAPDTNAPDEQGLCETQYVTDADNQRVTVIDATAVPTTPAPITGTESYTYRPDVGGGWSYVGFLGTSGTFSRNGGSPNLWAWATFDHTEWNDTRYDVQMQFQHDVTYTWTCHSEKRVDNPTFVPDPPANNGNSGGNSGGNQGCGAGGETTQDEATVGHGNHTCNDNNNNNNTNNANNGDNGCGAGGEGTQDDVFAGNSDHVCRDGHLGTIVHHYSWVFDEDHTGQTQTNTNIADGTDYTVVNALQAGHQAGVDYLKTAGPVTSDVRILSCISPGSKGGSWKPKDYYHGTVACSTTAFNSAPTLAGRMFDTPPTASLPGL